MFVPQRSGIFDEHDEVLEADFNDPEEPSAINEYVFANENFFGKHIFSRNV